jgi:thiol-disulfide isomerase/thioredoxin
VIAAVVGVGLLIALFAVIAISGGGDTEDAGPEFGAVEVPSAVLPPLPDVGADPSVGVVGPTIRSERPDGTTTVDPSSATEPTVLFFLAHWCSHCQAELPRLVTAADAGTFDNVRTVAVATSSDPSAPNHPPSAWLEREGWTGEVFYDDANNSAGTAYGLSSFPFMVFLNADGTVSQRIAGEQTPEAVEAAVEAIAPSQT